MKKMMIVLLMTVSGLTAHAQKYALVDMEYILSNIPAYQRANLQLNILSKTWQAEVEALNKEASQLYQDYQNEAPRLSQEAKKSKQDAIMQKEKEASELKLKYFGENGELAVKREEMLTPIQEKIYNAVKDVSEQRGYTMVVDRSSNSGIIFASPKIDISSDVLKKIGISGK
jgi:outer membrane protein